jgi:hypothetical protein
LAVEPNEKVDAAAAVEGGLLYVGRVGMANIGFPVGAGGAGDVVDLVKLKLEKTFPAAVAAPGEAADASALAFFHWLDTQ